MDGDDAVAPIWMIALPPVLTAASCWMLPVPVEGIALIVGAMFYGMWLENRVWQPSIRKRKAECGDNKPE